MAERRLLDAAQAKEVEEQLFATLRQQLGRMAPMPLPRQNFWDKVAQLLDTIEMEIHEVFRTVGPSLKLQTLQKRQANIRRTAADLARKRLVAMVQHSASIALRTEGGLPGQDLAALDWGRHDASERQFYNNVSEELSRFKQDVNWNSMQLGLASEELTELKPMAAGTTQLDSFVPEAGGLTGQGPPAIALEDRAEPLPEPEVDEEEILAKAEAFPELEGMSVPPLPAPSAAPTVLGEGVNHAAAMELAPSKKKEAMDFDAWAAAEAAAEPEGSEPAPEPEPQTGQMLRIRVLQTMEEPILTMDGEISLQAGDVQFIEESMANYLVDAGVAEIAAL